ncbi:MAG: ABC transporter substrate-binding protein [Spirochaetia bacterium]
MRRLLPGLLLLLIAGAAYSDLPPNGGTLVLAYYDEPESLNPLFAPEGFANVVINCFTDGLVTFSGGSAPGPGLAESWDISPDGMSWTFHMRKGIHFSDGTAVTAEDVQFTYEKGFDPKYGNRFTDFAQVVRSFRADGPDTFRIELKSPYRLLPSLLGRSIVPAHLLRAAGSAAEFGRHPIGSGPFTLSNWAPGRITLDANPDYFMGRPRIGRIVFRLFPDNKKAWVSLLQGQVDVVPDVDYEDYALIKDDVRFRGYEFLDNFCSCLLFNTRDPLFRERPMRQAIATAIDRKDLVDTVLHGRGLAASGPFKPGTWPYNPDPLLQAYDPRRAAQILRDLGWRDRNREMVREKEGRDLQFTVLECREDRSKGALARRLQWQLLQVGVRMDVVELPLHELVEKRMPAGDFQAALLPLNMFTDPDLSASLFWHSASIGGWNVTGYRNGSVDRLIERGKTISDFNERKNIYREMYAIIAQDAPAAFLYFDRRYAAVSDRLRGIAPQEISSLGGRMQTWYLEGK